MIEAKNNEMLILHRERRVGVTAVIFGRTMGKWVVPAVVGAVLAGCSMLQRPPVPKVEDYMPESTLQPMPTSRELFAESGGASSAGGTAQEKSLTLDACVRIALDRNPSLQAAREGVNAAREAVGETHAPYYPEVDINTGYSRRQQHAFLPSGIARPGIPSVIGPTDDWVASLRARMTLFDSGKRRAELQSASARRIAAEEERSKVLQDIAFEVHRAYYSLISAMEALSVAESNLRVAENHLRLTKERRSVGAVPQADVIRAQVEVENRKLALVRAENLVRVTRGELSTAMGLPVEKHINVEGQPEGIISPDEIDISKAIEQAVHARPELKGNLQRIADARSAVDRARSEFGPKMRAEASYGWEDADFLPRDEEWLAGVFIEIPLFTGFSTRHKVARTKAELSKEEANTRKLVLDVQREVWTAYSKLKEAFDAIPAAEAQLRDAREGMRTTQERYSVGAATVNDLLDSQDALAGAEVNLVAARWDYFIAHSTFRRATGDLAANLKD